MKKSGIIAIVFAALIVMGYALYNNFDNSEGESCVSEDVCSVGMLNLTLANPASVYCEGNNGTVDIRTDENGQYGVCVFEDGSECEEWKFYRGEC